MQILKTLSLFILLSSQISFAAPVLMNCKAGKKDLIHFEAWLENNQMTLTFDLQQGTAGELLSGQTVLLIKDPNRGNGTWDYAAGKFELPNQSRQFLHLEIGFPKKSSLSNLSGHFYLSPPSEEHQPSWLNSYALVCTPK